MATIQEKIKGGKIVSFKIKVCLGRDSNGKQKGVFMSYNSDLSPVSDGKTFVLNDGEFFLYIETVENGYDYTIYHANYSECDSGILEEPDLPISEAVAIVIQRFEAMHHS